MVIFNGWLRRRSVEILSDKEGVGWAPDSLLLLYAFCVDDEAISPAQAIKLSKIANISIAILRREAKFTDIIDSLLSYERPFKEDHGARFVDVHIIDIFKDKMISEPQAAKYSATYVHYISVVNMMIKQKRVLPLFMDLSEDATVVKTLCITRFDNPRLYTLSEKDILLLNSALTRSSRTTTACFLHVSTF